MRHATILVLSLLALTSAPLLALDLGNHASPKPVVAGQAPAPDPDVLRQGGDTIADATPIVLPYQGTGTTLGYTDDYDEVCPYSGSVAPDVVYTFTSYVDGEIFVDLCGSQYDTKVYVYDESLNLVGCNDDFYQDDACGLYVSYLDFVPVASGMTYYVVVDGYGSEAGEYQIYVDGISVPPCVLPFEDGMVDEGEPEIGDGYQDTYNSGCGCADGTLPFSTLDANSVFYGTSGWYLSAGGAEYRDTDWFTHQLGPDGYREFTIDAEFETYLFELGPQECENVAVLQSVPAGPCAPNSITVTGEPYSTVWLWVGPTTFSGPWPEYHYTVSMLPEDPVAVEGRSWTAVKGLFD